MSDNRCVVIKRGWVCVCCGERFVREVGGECEKCLREGEVVSKWCERVFERGGERVRLYGGGEGEGEFVVSVVRVS